MMKAIRSFWGVPTLRVMVNGPSSERAASHTTDVSAMSNVLKRLLTGLSNVAGRALAATVAVAVAVTAIALLSAPHIVQAQTGQNTPSSSPSLQPGWPNKPIRFIVGFAPGGGTDIVARSLAPKLGEILGQSVIVENKTGASGSIAADYVAKSPADGYTLLMGHSNSNAIAPFVLSKVPYNPATDFAPITYLGYVPNVLVVNTALPVNSTAELVALAKSKPGELSYGSSGIGSTQHLTGALFAQMNAISLNHVPYKGSGQAIIDLLANQITMNFDTVPPVLEQVRKGNLKALAVSTPKRLLILPNVPTFTEVGLTNFDITNWYSVMGPKDLNPALINQIDKATKQAMQDPGVKKTMEAQGLQTEGPVTPAAFKVFLGSEISKYQKLMKSLDIKGD